MDPNRRLCDDGSCVGVVGEDGVCSVCRRRVGAAYRAASNGRMEVFYGLLGVPVNADKATIKRAYRRLAKEFHPDVTGGDKRKTERFRRINEAYVALSAAEKKARNAGFKDAPVRPEGAPGGSDTGRARERPAEDRRGQFGRFGEFLTTSVPVKAAKLYLQLSKSWRTATAFHRRCTVLTCLVIVVYGTYKVLHGTSVVAPAPDPAEMQSDPIRLTHPLADVPAPLSVSDFHPDEFLMANPGIPAPPPGFKLDAPVAVPDPLEDVTRAGSLFDALRVARPMMGGHSDVGRHNLGTKLLGYWAAEGLELSAVAVQRNETSLALAHKDVDHELTKRLCVSGTVIQIARLPLEDRMVFAGLLITNSRELIFFWAARSTGELLAMSRARFCGIVTGTYDYQNRDGGTWRALDLVGVFDLPINRTPLNSSGSIHPPVRVSLGDAPHDSAKSHVKRRGTTESPIDRVGNSAKPQSMDAAGEDVRRIDEALKFTPSSKDKPKSEYKWRDPFADTPSSKDKPKYKWKDPFAE